MVTHLYTYSCCTVAAVAIVAALETVAAQQQHMAVHNLDEDIRPCSYSKYDTKMSHLIHMNFLFDFNQRRALNVRSDFKLLIYKWLQQFPKYQLQMWYFHHSNFESKIVRLFSILNRNFWHTHKSKQKIYYVLKCCCWHSQFGNQSLTSMIPLQSYSDSINEWNISN